MKCRSGKTAFDSKELGEEALIQNHIRNNHREGSGPQNIYECDDCGDWHFTSRHPISELLLDESVLKRIARERLSLQWEQKIK